MYVCMYVRMYVCMHACMHVCMYVYIVCTYVCMYITGVVIYTCIIAYLCFIKLCSQADSDDPLLFIGKHIINHVDTAAGTKEANKTSEVCMGKCVTYTYSTLGDIRGGGGNSRLVRHTVELKLV